MDESTWKFAQIVMWLIGVQTVVLAGIYAFLWNNLSKRIEDSSIRLDRRIDESNKRIEDSSIRLDKRMDDLSTKLEKTASELNAKIDSLEVKLNAKIDNLEVKFNAKIDPIQHAITELDKRLYGVETVLHMKDCCVLKQDQNLRKAE